MDSPIPESTDFFVFTKNDGNPDAFSVRFIIGDTEHTALISIEQGFIVMSFGRMSDRLQTTVANLLFDTVICCYHVDITHDSDNGLRPVKADYVGGAVSNVIQQILFMSEDFIHLAKETDNVDSLKRVYLSSMGMVEYGKAFIHRYEGELGPLVDECRERLESLSRFIDTIYGTVRDSIQDNLAHRSQEMSASMERLSRSTEALSVAVLGLTWFSAIMALTSLSISYEDSTLPPIWGVIAAATIPPIAAFMIYWIRRHSQNWNRPDR